MFQSNENESRYCSRCRKYFPKEMTRCPECDLVLETQRGGLTDEQIKKIRKPITIVLWIAIVVIIYFKYFYK